MAATKHQILVIQPLDKPSSGGVYELIRSAALIAHASVARADSVLRADSDIVQSIQTSIQSASLLIADVRNANPNVMYEVGFAQAQGKPVLLIANNSRSVPFDLAGVRVII
jgi:Nucleoside 2-deoxyribosyltransferase